MAIRVIMQSAPVLHKLDNGAHKDGYLAPEAFGNVTLGMAGSHVNPKTEEIK